VPGHDCRGGAAEKAKLTAGKSQIAAERHLARAAACGPQTVGGKPGRRSGLFLRGWDRGAFTPREERVLRMRFGIGIGMNTDHTLEEVGQQFSVTRERIRQIEAKALRKLKHPSRSRKLRSFLDN